MIGITRRDRKTNEWIHSQTKVEDVIKTPKKMKWRWAGHIARQTVGRCTAMYYIRFLEKRNDRGDVQMQDG